MPLPASSFGLPPVLDDNFPFDKVNLPGYPLNKDVISVIQVARGFISDTMLSNMQAGNTAALAGIAIAYSELEKGHELIATDTIKGYSRRGVMLNYLVPRLLASHHGTTRLRTAGHHLGQTGALFEVRQGHMI